MPYAPEGVTGVKEKINCTKACIGDVFRKVTVWALGAQLVI
jgi:hypothetical protein